MAEWPPGGVHRDVDDQQRRGDREHAVGERLEPRGGLQRAQFSVGSNGIVAISANVPPLRWSTSRQSSSGSAAKTSSGSARATIHDGSSSSASSWPGAPARVAGEDAQRARIGELLGVDAGRHVADAADDRLDRVVGVVELGEHDDRLRLHRPADVDDVVGARAGRRARARRRRRAAPTAARARGRSRPPRRGGSSARPCAGSSGRRATATRSGAGPASDVHAAMASAQPGAQRGDARRARSRRPASCEPRQPLVRGRRRRARPSSPGRASRAPRRARAGRAGSRARTARSPRRRRGRPRRPAASQRRADAERRAPRRAASSEQEPERADARADERRERAALAAAEAEEVREEAERDRGDDARARPPARGSGAGARRSSAEASTAPPSASAGARRARALDGRSPVASEIANGTTAPQATIGETMLIVPSESAL